MESSQFMDRLKNGLDDSVMDDKMGHFISHLYEKGRKQPVCKGDLTLDQFVTKGNSQ